MKRKAAGDAKRAVGYVRCSTEDQALSPDAQRAALVRWCEARGVALVAVFVDQGISGGAQLDRRPALMGAIAALREHGAGVLLAAKRDRLARDTMLAAMIERLVEREGATIRTADGTADGDGPEAQLMRRMLDAFAEYERLIIKARTRAALAVKKARGEKTGGAHAPYGWRADGGRLVPVEGEQRLLALVRDYRAEGLSLRAIAARLEANGWAPRGGGRWQPKTILRIANGQLAA